VQQTAGVGARRGKSVEERAPDQRPAQSRRGRAEEQFRVLVLGGLFDEPVEQDRIDQPRRRFDQQDRVASQLLRQLAVPRPVEAQVEVAGRQQPAAPTVRPPPIWPD